MSTRRNAAVLLWDVQQAVNAILRFTADISFEEYETNDLVHSAVERKFAIIGEALNVLSKQFPDDARDIPKNC